MDKQAITQLWYSDSPLRYVLIPLSKIYSAAVATRRFMYRHKLKKSVAFNVPVIVVGNLTVGGTGKTPLTIWLAQFLKLHGFKPGIVSRGYGGKAWVYPQIVTEESDPTIVGDEPLLIARHTHCPVVVDPNRPAAVRALLDKNQCNVIICDDGLQHYVLRRDIEICVVDGERRFGNGYCLPAGPLREPVSRKNAVDFVVTNGTPEPGEFQMTLLPRALYNIANPEAIKAPYEFVGQIVHAVAAIGNPHHFFKSLQQLGLTVVEHPFPDHHYLLPADINYGEDAIVVMTEKDAVKCRGFADERHWCLPVEPEVDVAFGEQLLTKLKALSKSAPVEELAVEC